MKFTMRNMGEVYQSHRKFEQHFAMAY